MDILFSKPEMANGSTTGKTANFNAGFLTIKARKKVSWMKRKFGESKDENLT